MEETSCKLIYIFFVQEHHYRNSTNLTPTVSIKMCSPTCIEVSLSWETSSLLKCTCLTSLINHETRWWCCGKRIHLNKVEIRVWQNFVKLRAIQCQGWKGGEKWPECIKCSQSRGQQLAIDAKLGNKKLLPIVQKVFQFRSLCN